MLEENENARDFLIRSLEKHGCKVHGFECIEDFWDEMESNPPDVLILETNISEQDGIDIIQKIRSQKIYQNLVIIIATTSDCEHDVVLGLDSGANDYIIKPIHIEELLTRIRVIMRRNERKFPKNLLEYKNIKLYVREHEVYVDQEALALDNIDFEILRYLLENTGITLNRKQIQKNIWGSTFGGKTRIVDTHINKLRQKLGKSAPYIKTVRKFGYKLE